MSKINELNDVLESLLGTIGMVATAGVWHAFDKRANAETETPEENINIAGTKLDISLTRMIKAYKQFWEEFYSRPDVNDAIDNPKTADDKYISTFIDFLMSMKSSNVKKSWKKFIDLAEKFPNEQVKRLFLRVIDIADSENIDGLDFSLKCQMILEILVQVHDNEFKNIE